ncbi:Oidioi.mRNA.OKI2018_I69.PAR.g10837.t1.cds [Oikopleura dioica]|uniref:Oidioi.mRNA.OKI2018_I69.PAR.g10837.t1.cds n=1 Tax=Oikopleura dioica TaxID=34765 RepID=A0ABN7RY56_OIKDI|nr:Oidioi.mRNA.OKI2018_I69.PAR.g10837.t1.cds [Oikopleura dioica]
MFQVLTQQAKRLSIVLLVFSILLVVSDAFCLAVEVKWQNGLDLIPSFGIGIVVGIFAIAAGSIGIVASKLHTPPPFFNRFRAAGCLGNFSGSLSIIGFLWILPSLAWHVYQVSMYPSYWEAVLGKAILISFFTFHGIQFLSIMVVMFVSFFLANFHGSSCCCRDPLNLTTVAPLSDQFLGENVLQTEPVPPTQPSVNTVAQQQPQPLTPFPAPSLYQSYEQDKAIENPDVFIFPAPGDMEISQSQATGTPDKDNKSEAVRATQILSAVEEEDAKDEAEFQL